MSPFCIASMCLSLLASGAALQDPAPGRYVHRLTPQDGKSTYRVVTQEGAEKKGAKVEAEAGDSKQEVCPHCGQSMEGAKKRSRAFTVFGGMGEDGKPKTFKLGENGQLRLFAGDAKGLKSLEGLKALHDVQGLEGLQNLKQLKDLEGLKVYGTQGKPGEFPKAFGYTKPDGAKSKIRFEGTMRGSDGKVKGVIVDPEGEVRSFGGARIEKRMDGEGNVEVIEIAPDQDEPKAKAGSKTKAKAKGAHTIIIIRSGQNEPLAEIEVEGEEEGEESGEISQHIEVVVPELEIAQLELPAIEIPHFEMPQIEIPEIVIPHIEIPNIEIPQFEMQEIEIPAIEIPHFEIPAIEIPQFEISAIEMPELQLRGVTVPMVRVKKGSGNCCEAISAPKPAEGAASTRHLIHL